MESEHRVGGGRTSWARDHHGRNPNLEPLGQREEGTRSLGASQVRDGDRLVAAGTRSPNTRVSDLVIQLEMQRKQQLAKDLLVGDNQSKQGEQELTNNTGG